MSSFISDFIERFSGRASAAQEPEEEEEEEDADDGRTGFGAGASAPMPSPGSPALGPRPLPFIQVDPETSKLVVTDEARAALSALQGSIGVCSVAGLYRTGKSYILNQLAGQEAGFGIGSSVQAHTKGVWVWGAPLEDGAAGSPKNILLLDTEGLSSISQTEGHDAKIFCLAILLSSIFVYNSEKVMRCSDTFGRCTIASRVTWGSAIC